MHGNDVLFPFMVIRCEVVCWQQRYVSIFGPLVPTTTSSFPTPRNQLPPHRSVVNHFLSYSSSVFELTVAMCERTPGFVCDDLMKVAKLIGHLFAYKPTTS